MLPGRFRSLWRLRAFVRPYSGRMVTMLVCASLGVAASIVVPLLIEAAVDGPIRRADRGALLPLFFAALGLGVTEAVLILTRRWIQSVAVLKVEKEIRDEMYAHLQRLPVEFHDAWQTGQLLSRATTDLGTIRRFLGFGAIFLVVNTLQYLTVIGLLIAMYPPLGAVVCVASLPVIYLGHRFGRHYARVSRRVQDQQGDVATLAEEAASGIRVTKAFGRGPLLQAGFAQSTARLYASAMDSVALRGRFWAMLELIPNLTMAVVVFFGAIGVAHHAMTLGALIAFTTMLVLLQWPIIDIGWILALSQEAATAADRVYEVFDAKRTIDDPDSPIELDRVRGRLAFEHVTFTYPGSDHPVLQDVDLVIEPGETLAIVGATGSGKTTLASLVCRLYDVTSGRVTLDGRDIRDLPLESLRGLVATAFEDPVLFSMSVRENLTLGAADASGEQIEAALRLAQADFVHDLPWGLDTRIGEQGLSLSGGQRQRLALARAVLTRPAVLVLDDPLSALDVHTEALVEEALAAVLTDTTALVVVHRPSTVALADRVALLDGGRIAAVGTHAELMQRPDYAALLSVADEWERAS
jgi:ATP-binding cassette subfamily B protein